tara:strand:+ start:671 stop:1084 length:414 start_codon:yes stop_codon:yes gene_type:complete
MATIDITRLKNNQEKRSIGISVARFTSDQATGALADNYVLFKLPAECVVIHALINVITASQATVTASVGFSGGTELLSAQALSAVAVKDSGAKALVTGTGKDLTIKFGTAIPTAGEFEVIITYYEPLMGTGFLTSTN